MAGKDRLSQRNAEQGSPRGHSPGTRATHRDVPRLRRIYEQGYIGRVTFEKMKRDIEARVERLPA